jgi:hypothetical protein
MKKIKCATLFDITHTGVNLRRDNGSWQDRCRQSNFETVLQIISLRSLPENISLPRKVVKNSSEYGFSDGNKITVWEFFFDVPNIDVFSSEQSDFGLLFNDCDGVPMYIGLSESVQVEKGVLQGTGTNTNIYFSEVEEKTKNEKN